MLLAIETSCDDTCAAVLDGPRILSNVISSQAAAHAGFGGVVPEVAARHHLELVEPVVAAALAEAGVTLDDVEAVAATAGPGLIGALLVGVSAAKAIAAARRTPPVRPSTSRRGCWGSATRAARRSSARPRGATPKPSRCRWRCPATPASTSASAA